MAISIYGRFSIVSTCNAYSGLGSHKTVIGNYRSPLKLLDRCSIVADVLLYQQTILIFYS